MGNEYKNVTLKKSDIREAINSFDGEYVNFGIEFNRINGEKILYVTNGEFGDNRIIKIINARSK
jgi:hypothetical protein